jgi:hypothetical protein
MKSREDIEIEILKQQPSELQKIELQLLLDIRDSIVSLNKKINTYL